MRSVEKWREVGFKKKIYIYVVFANMKKEAFLCAGIAIFFSSLLGNTTESV